MTTGWLKTLDGADVYTDDGEWYWLPRFQQWVHDPALLVMPPAPLTAKINREWDRLSTGWPSLRSAIFPARGEEIRSPFWRFVAGFLRGVLLYVWGWEGIVRGHLLGFFQFVVGTLVDWACALFHLGSDVNSNAPSWLTTHDDVSFLYFMAIVPSIMIIYFLYLLRVGDVDEHKGNVMAAATIAVTGYRRHKAHQMLDFERMQERAFRNAQQ